MNSDFLQMEALKQAKISNPTGRWWIKADACDVHKGLMESMKGEWSGDEDLGSDNLKNLHKEYQLRCKAIREFGKKEQITTDVRIINEQLSEDLVFLVEGESKSRDLYTTALNGKRTAEATLMELSWDLTGYEELLKQAKKFENLLEISSAASVKETVLKLIGPLKLEFLSYLKGLYSKKRCAASHLMIFMIADECRNRKPYAVPVQFLSYKSITDSELRELELEVERAMNSLGMIVIGKVCFNLI